MALHPLGRVVEHDARSRAYAYTAPRRALSPVDHVSHAPILDQGDLGSCTGNAAVGALSCDPLYSALPLGTPLTEDEAVALYSAATRLDSFPGAYKPDDTGSSGLAVAKATQQAGLISGYQHAFSVDDALTALQAGPVITGISWWSSFDTPSTAGLVSIDKGASIRGGHEICAVGYDANRLIWFRNSWGPDWGAAGRFCMTATTWAQLLADQGDVTVFVPLTSPKPTADPDAALAIALRPWLATRANWSTRTTTGKAANAARNWLTAKGI